MAQSTYKNGGMYGVGNGKSITPQTSGGQVLYTPSGGGEPYRGGKYDYISSLATPQQYKNVYQKYGVISSNSNYGGGSDGGYYDRSAELKSYWDSWLKEMNAYWKTQYDQQMKNNRIQFEKTRDPINLNYKRNEKAIRAMLGPDSGRGVGLLSGNNNDWANRIADSRNWLGNQNAQTLADYHKNVADTKKSYAEKMASLMI